MALGATLRDLGVPAVLGLTATATMRTRQGGFCDERHDGDGEDGGNSIRLGVRRGAPRRAAPGPWPN